jgi:hypothetical protein
MPKESALRSFIDELRAHQSRVSITSSTVRSQGAGTGEIARRFLAEELEIARLRAPSERAYLARLDEATEALRNRLKGKARTFGLARKLLNIYIRDCVYSRILCAHYRLEPIEPFLEVPLDGIVGRALVREACDGGQPRRLLPWRTIKGLTRPASDAYQAFATELAGEEGIARVHLDVMLWGEGR